MASTSVVWPFPGQVQRTSTWCWAAAAVAIDAYYGGTGWTQCQLVRAVVPGCDACCDGHDDPALVGMFMAVPAPCAVPWALELALQAPLGRSARRVPVDGASFDLVRSELGAGRVVAARWGTGPEEGHYVVIHGCSMQTSHGRVTTWDSLRPASQETRWFDLLAPTGRPPLTHLILTGPANASWRAPATEDSIQP